MNGKNKTKRGGFSMVKVILSDALSTAAFRPDYPDIRKERETREKKQTQGD